MVVEIADFGETASEPESQGVEHRGAAVVEPNEPTEDRPASSTWPGSERRRSTSRRACQAQGATDRARVERGRVRDPWTQDTWTEPAARRSAGRWHRV